MQRNEHRKHPRGLADLLLPYALIDDGILLQQDGSLLAGCGRHRHEDRRPNSILETVGKEMGKVAVSRVSLDCLIGWKLLKRLAPQVGFEPTTLRLTAECSTIELLRSKVSFYLNRPLQTLSNCSFCCSFCWGARLESDDRRDFFFVGKGRAYMIR